MNAFTQIQRDTLENCGSALKQIEQLLSQNIVGITDALDLYLRQKDVEMLARISALTDSWRISVRAAYDYDIYKKLLETPMTPDQEAYGKEQGWDCMK